MNFNITNSVTICKVECMLTGASKCGMQQLLDYERQNYNPDTNFVQWSTWEWQPGCTYSCPGSHQSDVAVFLQFSWWVPTCICVDWKQK